MKRYSRGRFRYGAVEEQAAILDNERVALSVSVLVDGLNRDYPVVGDMQTPHQALAVQALRNTRCVEEIAHGRDIRMAIAEFTIAARSAPEADTPAARNDGPSTRKCGRAWRHSFYRICTG
jgi:hypothetical protein